MGKKQADAKVRDFDIANYLDSEEAIAEYLNMELAEGDPHYIKLALANIARVRNMTELSNRAGISRAGLYKALAPGSRPEYGTIQKIINALGMRLAVAPAFPLCHPRAPSPSFPRRRE